MILSHLLRVLARERRIHVARRDGVDPDTVGRQLERKHLGELHQGRLGGRIGRHVLRPYVPEDRGDIDDGARSPFAHVAPYTA